MGGWRDEAVVPSRGRDKLPDLGADPQQFLGNLGITGATAYFGLLDAASAKEGDIVFVSAAAGAVGSAVVQIAKAKGMTVIGSAGGEEKCEFVRSLGADEVVDYAQDRSSSASPRPRQKASTSISTMSAASHLDAALALARNNARFAICGMIEGYNKPEPTSLRFIMRIIAARIRLQGFLVFDYQSRMGEFYRDMGGWLNERRSQVARDGRRRPGTDSRRIPRPVQGRERREDAGPASRATCRRRIADS